MPSSGTYAARFGSLIRAYSLVGFTPERDYEYIEINRALRRKHATVVAETIEEIERIGGAVSRDPATDLLTVNDEFTASIVLSRCQQTQAGSKRWKIRLDTGLAPDLTVALRMDGKNEAVLDYYLLPLPMLDTNRIRLRRRKRADAGRLPVRDPGALFRHGRAGPHFGTSFMTDRDDSITITLIPVDRIRVLNPRERDGKRFREIVDSIRNVGLKQPIKVTRLNGSGGEAEYGLVYGQGRLEAFIALGQKEIPAIVADLSEEDSLLMSLVENVARRHRRPSELLREIGALSERGYTDRQIARKIGFSKTYVHDIRRLLKGGEERLLTAVETGKMPLNVAVDIAAADDEHVQKVLAEAYESGALSGRQLIEAKRQVERRLTVRKGPFVDSGQTRPEAARHPPS